jgi:hypothetical protein
VELLVAVLLRTRRLRSLIPCLLLIDNYVREIMFFRGLHAHFFKNVCE